MLKLSSLLQHAALALALSCGAGSAAAGVLYHVDVNTSALSGSGFLDFAVAGWAGAPLASATVSNLTGAFGAEAARNGSVAGAIPAGFALTSAAGDNWLTQEVSFGGMFGFDISIAGPYETVDSGDGATFVIGLFDALMAQYTVAAEFAAQPGLNGAPASLTPSADEALASINAVPEPAAPALLLAALLAAAAVRRRHQS